MIAGTCSAFTWHIVQLSWAWHTEQLITSSFAVAPCDEMNSGDEWLGGFGNAAICVVVRPVALVSGTWHW
jgi:hypothetical protein